ncbi:hypothetical protein PPTG_17774 [Phytophthora nicotianae INRA-310]|uniref:Uncharacterized protein n=1 Tax=Phytophthora nicotianae (strain INRA-310) TaxID=761204 RepID=W2PJU4_PHYN3|nr:hypothetical protein PPTG_17774 [Phytophthora nicotianae INRA-310]ETN00891.1 hypothetical protein PPTG_17774 [Phytophthora nicotianae INRA-310]
MYGQKNALVASIDFVATFTCSNKSTTGRGTFGQDYAHHVSFLKYHVVTESGGKGAECAIYTAPLCYPGICEAAEFADPTIDVFVKRLPATFGDAKTAHNVWLIQGGPIYSSIALESDMVDLHERLKEAVNMYMMDHRGTGRRTLFDCVAAQTTTTGSLWGREKKSSEVPACAKICG